MVAVGHFRELNPLIDYLQKQFRSSCPLPALLHLLKLCRPSQDTNDAEPVTLAGGSSDEDQSDEDPSPPEPTVQRKRIDDNITCVETALVDTCLLLCQQNTTPDSKFAQN